MLFKQRSVFSVVVVAARVLLSLYLIFTQYSSGPHCHVQGHLLMLSTYGCLLAVYLAVSPDEIEANSVWRLRMTVLPIIPAIFLEASSLYAALPLMALDAFLFSRGDMWK